MADLVIDASTIAKWYIPEQHHARARSLRDDYLDGTHELYAPALLPFETVNALKYSGHYDARDRLLEAATSITEYGITLVPFQSIGPVAEIAHDLDITVYDAAYVTLAVTRDSTVYTADQQLLDDLDGSEYTDAASHIETYSG